MNSLALGTGESHCNIEQQEVLNQHLLWKNTTRNHPRGSSALALLAPNPTSSANQPPLTGNAAFVRPITSETSAHLHLLSAFVSRRHPPLVCICDRSLSRKSPFHKHSSPGKNTFLALHSFNPALDLQIWRMHLHGK